MKNISVLTTRGGRNADVARRFQLASRYSTTTLHKPPRTIDSRQKRREHHADSYSPFKRTSRGSVLRRVCLSSGQTNVFLTPTPAESNCPVHQRRRASGIRNTANPSSSKAETPGKNIESQAGRQADQIQHESQPQSQPSSNSPNQNDPLFPAELLEGTEDMKTFHFRDSEFLHPEPLYQETRIQISEFTRALYPFGRPMDDHEVRRYVKDPSPSQSPPSIRQALHNDRKTAFNPDLIEQPSDHDKSWWTEKVLAWMRVQDLRGRGFGYDSMSRVAIWRTIVIIFLAGSYIFKYLEMSQRQRIRRQPPGSTQHAGPVDEEKEKETTVTRQVESKNDEKTAVNTMGMGKADADHGRQERPRGTAIVPITGASTTSSPFTTGGENIQKDSGTNSSAVVQVLDSKNEEDVERAVPSPSSSSSSSQPTEIEKQPATNPQKHQRADDTEKKQAQSSSSWKSWLLFWR